MPRRSPPRLPAVQYVGLRRFFVTVCTGHRARHFLASAIATEAIAQLWACAAQYSFAVIAYCIMPDHVRLVVEGRTDDADLQRFMHGWKLRVAFHARRHHDGALWQRGYFERALRTDESIIDTARYVLANPVRAGLVAYPTDYPWIGSFVTTVDALLEVVQDT